MSRPTTAPSTTVVGSTPNPNAPQASAAPGQDWMNAVSTLRSTNSWIVKGFTALAALLIGSGPLFVGFDNLQSWPRVVIGAVAAGIALLGVWIVIHAASQVMLPEVIDLPTLITQNRPGALKDFRERIDNDPVSQQLYLGDGIHRIDGLLKETESWQRTVDQLSAYTAEATGYDSTHPAPENSPLQEEVARKQLPAVLAAAGTQLQALVDRASALLAQAGYRDMKSTFDRSRRLMFVGAAMTAAGVAVYLGAFGIDTSKSSSSSQTDASASSSASASAAETVGVLTWLKPTSATSPSVTDVRHALSLSAETCDKIPVTFQGDGSDASPWTVTTIQVPGGCSATPESFTVNSHYASIAITTPTSYAMAPTKAPRDISQFIAVGLASALLVGAGAFFLGRRRT
jgi:hypothetical protein